MTPRRKKAGKALARGSMKSLVDDCFSNKRTQHFVTLKIGRIIRTEIKKLSSSSSILRSPHTSADLKEFKFEHIFEMIQANAPFLLTVLLSATKTRVPRKNQQLIICVCVSILLKYRCKEQNLLQMLISLVLYASQCSKMVSNYNCIILLIMQKPTIIIT